MKYLGRFWPLLAGVTVFALAAATARVHAQKDADNTSAIVGAWTLDKKLSDLADNRPRGGGGGGQHRGGGGGGGFPGGGGFGGGGHRGGGGGSGYHGGGGGSQGGHSADPDESARVNQAWRDFVEAPDHMTIVQAESMMVITTRDGRTTRLSLDGKKIKDESTNIERKTKWENGKLVSEISGSAGHATEIYEVNPTQHELLVVVRLEPSGDESAHLLHRLYTLDAH